MNDITDITDIVFNPRRAEELRRIRRQWTLAREAWLADRVILVIALATPVILYFTRG